MTSDAGSAEVLRGTAEWVFKPIAERCPEFPDDLDLQGFCALRGCRYQGELMVIGRACNWEKLFEEPPDGDDWEEVASKLARWRMSPTSGARQPLQHNHVRVLPGRQAGDATQEDWPTHLVWSNLYKVSPYGKNPGAPLQRAQRDGCQRLLNLEIGTFRPKRVLFLTGWDWAEELVCAPPKAREPADTLVDRVRLRHSANRC